MQYCKLKVTMSGCVSGWYSACDNYQYSIYVNAHLI